MGNGKNHYLIIKGETGRFHFNMMAKNGKVVASSRTVKTKEACEELAQTAKTILQDESRFIISESKDKQFYFIVYDAGGVMLIQSEMYKRRGNVKAAVKRVSAMHNAPTLFDYTTKIG